MNCVLAIDYGPGYRIYFEGKNKRLLILLCGGHKKLRMAKASTDYHADLIRDLRDPVETAAYISSSNLIKSLNLSKNLSKFKLFHCCLKFF